MPAKKINKYLYGWKISVFYGYGCGWEYEVFETTWKETRARLKEYRENQSYPVKACRGRETNPEYIEVPA